MPARPLAVGRRRGPVGAAGALVPRRGVPGHAAGARVHRRREPLGAARAGLPARRRRDPRRGGVAPGCLTLAVPAALAGEDTGVRPGAAGAARARRRAGPGPHRHRTRAARPARVAALHPARPGRGALRRGPRRRPAPAALIDGGGPAGRGHRRGGGRQRGPRPGTGGAAARPRLRARIRARPSPRSTTSACRAIDALTASQRESALW